MYVYSEARPAGGGKKFGVGLDDADMKDVEGWESLSVGDQHRKMTDRADMLLVMLMFRRGDISQEFLQQRVREIRDGAPA